MSSRSSVFVIIFLIASAFGIWALHSTFLQEFENRTWDFRLKTFAAKKPEASKVRIIDIDQVSLDYFASEEQRIFWPWPRNLYGEVVLEFLKRANAKAVAFDVLFTEQQYSQVKEDESFAASIKQSALPVVSAVALRSSQSAGERAHSFELFAKRQTEFESKNHFSARYLSHPHTLRYPDVTLAVDPLLEVSHAFGNVTGEPDSDGVFRHFFPGGFTRDVPVLALPLALLEVSGARPLQNLREIQDDRGRLAVQFLGPKRTIPTVPFAQVYQSVAELLDGRDSLIPLKDFEGTYVFVGMSAPGLLDLRPTPLAEDFPGVEFNATILENLISGNFIQKPSALISHALVILFVLALSWAGLFISISNAKLQLVSLLGLFFALIGMCIFTATRGWWVPFIAPFSAGLLSLVASLTYQYLHEGKRHRFIRNAFRFYVSPSVIDQIVKDPTHLSLGGERRELTILFSDIANFTSISESLEASTLVTLLNGYLTFMTEIVMQHGGTVDKYVGDAVVAFWNAPLSVPEHAVNAVKAAIACQQKLERQREVWKEATGVDVRNRIGINTGMVSVGNFGSKDRFNYTVIGDAANTASRLEGANKLFGTGILLSNATFEGLKGLIPCRKVGDIKVVGKHQAIGFYEPLSTSAVGTDSTCQQFEGALRLFESKMLKEALEEFKKLDRDPVSRRYCQRIEAELATDLKDWSPIWEMSEK